MELKERLRIHFIEVDLSQDGFTISMDKLIDYVIEVYKRGEGDDMPPLNQKKDDAIYKYKIPKKDVEILKFNKSSIVSKMVTHMLHMNSDREFELYVTALEGATILLDVVRRPIDDTLEDEKWLNALKAKKQGFKDAEELIDSANKIAERMTGIKDVDLEDHVEEVIFKRGAAERLATEYQNKK